VKVPVPLKIGALTVATTAFYTLVGQLVPQKEVLPPKETVLPKEMSQEDMVKAGRQIMEGKGLCFTCHTIGNKGPLRFPDLAGVGERATHRVPGLSDVDYFAQTLYDPNAFIVPGFNPGMPTINKPPIGLSDQEILAVIAYLQSLGGKVTVTMDSKVWPLGAGAHASAAPAGKPSS
jgi:mono/diheme cytochrome c family protein